MQQEHVGDVMSSLLEHPLGLYPHLEESLPPQVCKTLLEWLKVYSHIYYGMYKATRIVGRY